MMTAQMVMMVMPAVAMLLRFERHNELVIEQE